MASYYQTLRSFGMITPSSFSREFIEGKGFKFIYGDTDSLFVHLGEGNTVTAKESGTRLAEDLNKYLVEEIQRRFKLKSFLEIEFENLFLRFFMPTIRGNDKGSKKRYAGLVYDDSGEHKLYFAGMESSRRDWTVLAKEFQSDLFTLLFRAENFASLHLYINKRYLPTYPFNFFSCFG